MLKYETGDIAEADTMAIAYAANCVGVVSIITANNLRTRYPLAFKGYIDVCKCGNVRPGQVVLYEREGYRYPRYLLALLVVKHWRDSPTLPDIAKCLDAVKREIRKRNIKSIAVPALGVGMTGLKWEVVCALMEKKFRDMADVRIHIYKPKSYIDILQA